jgi:nucleoside-diphosphate-sugar epimerase
MTKITLVTGCTGFIGSHLVDELVLSGRKVRCLARPGSAVDHLNKLKVEIIYGDLTDLSSLRGIGKDVTAVFHLAAIARPMAIKDEEYFKVNFLGTKNLLEVFKNHSLDKFIHMSSISAVGPSRNGRPVNEKTPPNPIDVYGQSKLKAEKIALEYLKEYCVPLVILRPSMVFGPRDFEMLKLFKTVKTRFFPICGSESGHFEFCYVGNLVQACLLAEKRARVGEIYHVSNERPYTLKEVLDAISRAQGVKLLPFCFPNFLMSFGGRVIELLGGIFKFQPPFSRNTVKWMSTDFWVSDISKIKKELDYFPKFSLEEGVKRTTDWYRENNFL